MIKARSILVIDDEEEAIRRSFEIALKDQDYHVKSEKPEFAKGEKIICTPTVIRMLPKPIRKTILNFNSEKYSYSV